MATKEDEQILDVGVIGCARIAKKNCTAANKAFASCAIKSIASRNADKASAFINEVFAKSAQRPTLIFTGEDAYKDLLETKESCDAVYIPLPTKLHDEYVIKALCNKKHVLLEKPVAVSAQAYRDMLAVASKEGKFLMDGTMFVHAPRTRRIVKSIPNPNRIHMNFTFDGGADFLQNDIRVKKDGDLLGCVGDLGWYCGTTLYCSLSIRYLCALTLTIFWNAYISSSDGITCLFRFECRRTSKRFSEGSASGQL